MIFRQNIKNIHIFILLKCFHTLFFSFWSISECLNLDESQNHSHCWKGFEYTKMLENHRICGSWRIFLKNSRQLNYSGQTRDSWVSITKQQTDMDHSGINKVLRIKLIKLLNRVLFINSTNIFSCGLYVNIFMWHILFRSVLNKQ